MKYGALGFLQQDLSRLFNVLMFGASDGTEYIVIIGKELMRKRVFEIHWTVMDSRVL